MRGRIRRLGTFAMAAVLGLGAAACGGGDEETSGNDDAGSQESAAAGSEGGTGTAAGAASSDSGGEPVEFVMAVHADPSGVDPQTAVAGSDNVAIFPAFDALLSYDPESLELGPGLATSWKYNKDFTELTLTLRKGVKFQDGTDVNAKAAVASMKRFKEIGQYPYLDDVTAFEVLGPYKFKLEMAAPNSSMTSILAERAGMLVSVAAAEKMTPEEFNRAPVGAGAFRLVEWRSGDRLIYERFENYWNADSIAIDRIVMRVIPDRQAAVNALLSGEIDFSEGLDGADVDRLKANDDLVVSTPVGMWYYQIYLNLSQPPLDDPLVRRAIAHAIDRDVLIEGAVNGLGEPAWTPFPDEHWAYDDEMTGIWEYDPELSRDLLAEAGHPDGVSFTVTHQPSPTETRRIEIVQSMLAEVGIDMQLNPMDLNQGITEYFENQSFNAALFAYPGRLDATDLYFSKFDQDQFTNVAKRAFPGMQDLLAKARSTDDPDELARIYREMNVIYKEEVPEIPLYFRLNLTAHSADFTGYVPDLMGQARIHTMRPAG